MPDADDHHHDAGRKSHAPDEDRTASSSSPQLGTRSTASRYIVQQTPKTGAVDDGLAKVLGKRRHVDFIRADTMSDARKLRVLSSATRIYIIPDKLTDAEIDKIRSLVTRLGGMNASLAFANVIVTALQSAKRVQRHLNDDVRERKVPVLHMAWLYDSAEEQILQRYDDYTVYPEGRSTEGEPCRSLAEPAGSDGPPGMASSLHRESARDHDSSREATPDSTHESSQGDPLARDGDARSDTAEDETQAEIDPSWPSDAPLWQNTEYACLRPTPLRSRYNQDLVETLETLRLQRILGEKSQYHATAYGRAISAIKAYPHSLAPNPNNAKNIKGIGPKIAKLVVQYYREGSIAEVGTIRTDDAYRRMTSFMELYGVGPTRARELYSEGARTLDDVIRKGRSIGTHLHVDECLRILPDLQTKIPRDEVEEIAQYIQDTLDSIKSGCIHTICGGYRRGKPMSNDVDIVITDTLPQRTEKPVALLYELLERLKKKAFMTHVINVTTPSGKYERIYSHLDIAEIVVLPPKTDIVREPRYRRVDIILGPYKTHGAAILGWTGSRQFERDLRLVAKNAGYKFHSTGLVPIGEQDPLDTPREEDIFAKLRIPVMPPTLRNCDA